MIELDNVTVRVGSFMIENVTFTVPSGRYGILMGRTGSGKTTLLEAICGPKPVNAGAVRLMGVDVTRAKPAERGIGYVPQDGSLFVTMSVRDQLAFPLTIRKWKRKAIHHRVEELAELLHIEHLLHRMPQGLSGGETQRVALGRALACRPSVLCLDEPLSALDEETREQMYHLIRSVRQRTGVTTLHVTHSPSEARRLGDQIYPLRDGTVEHVVPEAFDEWRSP